MASTSGSSSAWRSGGVERADDLFRVQALGVGNALLLVDAGENDAIGEAQACDQIGLEHLAAQRVGARLQHCPEARLRIDGAQRAQGFANGRGVVGKVFDDGDAADFGAHFKPALDALEGGERLDDGFLGDALAGGKRGGGGGVERVVLAGKVHLELGPERAVVPDLPAREAVLMAQIADLPVGSLAESRSARRGRKRWLTHSVTLSLPS